MIAFSSINSKSNRLSCCALVKQTPTSEMIISVEFNLLPNQCEILNARGDGNVHPIDKKQIGPVNLIDLLVELFNRSSFKE